MSVNIFLIQRLLIFLFQLLSSCLFSFLTFVMIISSFLFFKTQWLCLDCRRNELFISLTNPKQMLTHFHVSNESFLVISSFFLLFLYQTHCLCLTHHKCINSLPSRITSSKAGFNGNMVWKLVWKSFTVHLLLDILIRRVNGHSLFCFLFWH